MADRYQGLRYEEGKRDQVEDYLVTEEALQINVNGSPFTVIMQTPGREEHLTRGLLYAEDICRKSLDNYRYSVVSTNDMGNIVSVNIEANESDLGDGYSSTRTLLSVSSCGICGKRELDDLGVSGDTLNSTEKLDPDMIESMFQTMRKAQKGFTLTGGSHACAAFTLDGQMLSIMEDIGRHNAVDKVVGDLLMKDQLKQARCLLVSGRVSYEIVTKAFVAKTPFLAAVSAPSTLAVDYAKELGITLFGFCRDGRATCYSNIGQLHIPS